MISIIMQNRSGQGDQLPRGLKNQINLGSGKLPTYPSPMLTKTLTSHLGQNDGLGEG